MNKDVSSALLGALLPTDPKLFSRCTRIYQSANSLQVVTDETLGVTENPMNKGMLTVMEDLKAQGVSEKDKKSIYFRLMHMGDLFENKHEGLRQFIKESAVPGFIDISEALFEACATAKLVLDGDEIYFDIEDVVRIAKAIEDAD